VLFDKAIKAAGKTMVTWPYSKYIDKYSVMTIVGPKMLAKPDTLRKFTLALLKGYDDAVREPEAAAATILKSHPEFDRDYIVASAKTIDRAVWDSTTRSKGLGMLDATKMAATIDLTAKYWTLPRKPAPTEIYTNGVHRVGARAAQAIGCAFLAHRWRRSQVWWCCGSSW
jgi:ABC-type nitrate/sulfonate/bicarbonate transport system substrate-binding protein